MRIGIDARFLTHPQCGGFKTYTECLVAALAQVDRDNEYVLYLDRVPDRLAVLPEGPNFSLRVVPGALPGFGLPWREQIGLPRQAARDRLDLLHSPALTAPLALGCASVVTLHDTIWRTRRGEKADVRRRVLDWYYRRVPESAARRAAVIVTVSQASKAEIVSQLQVPEEKVVVTYEAARGDFRPLARTYIEERRRKQELPAEFVLAIGSADPRKNLATLLGAYALLPQDSRKRFPLVIAMTHARFVGSLRLQAARLGIGGQVLFRAVGPAAEDMALYFNAASLFVFPSLCEGFGLPPIEAMACGTPVVAANNSSMPEVLGDAALLIDISSAEAIAGPLGRVLSHEALRRDLSYRGCVRAARFSWQSCARETIAGYRLAVAGASGAVTSAA